MGAEIFGKPLAVTNTAASLTALMGFADKKFLSNLTLRADKDNTALVWLGKSDVTPSTNQIGYLQPMEAISVDIQAFTNTNELYLVAASNQTVYALCVV